MGRATPAVILRQQLLRWAAAVALTLSLLAMHQLSLNHTAANPTNHPTNHQTNHQGSAVAAVPAAAAVGPLDALNAHAPQARPGGGHAHPVEPLAGQQPATEDDACPDCPQHHVMALTCLAALVLLAVGWALRLPTAWRGVRLPRLLPPSLPLRWRSWQPPLSLVQLSISRT